MEDVSQKRYEQLPQFLAVVSRNVNRLVDLVQDMLTLSSLESGPVLKRELVYPDQLTQDVIERLSPLANEKNILIRCQTIERPFTADIGKVDQVLQNLLGNAIKYVQAGGQVEVRWQKSNEHDGNHVILRVIDNGPGILPQHLPRLFERFYRVDRGRSRDQGGTGLGLAIVKHAMLAQSGSVKVESVLGQGTEFICSFPNPDAK
jgi:two-component system phosphate regulon sensor histidine kinase PhoR